MDWIAASLLSAFVLGFYDLCTKHAVRENAVVPVLFFSTLCGATVWTVLLTLGRVAPDALPAGLITMSLTGAQHAQLALKSAIVAASWICTYFAVKHLPVSLAAPIRATSPLWTLLAALIILAERPTLLQTAGILTTLASFVALSLAGRKDGVHFHRDKWVALLVLGTLFGAASSLYDKYLLGVGGFTVPTVQAWFSIYLVVIFTPLAIGWKLRWWPRNEFHWRPSIVAIALFLLVADYAYFSALRDPAALISLVVSLRRGSTLVAFAGGLLFFKERNGWQKLPAVVGVIVGIVLTIVGR
jgi:transporter family protein